MTYSSSIAMSRDRRLMDAESRSGFHRQGRVMARARPKIMSNTIILVVLACLLGLMYLTQVSKTNAYGYQINSLKVQQQSLANQRQGLENEAASLQSLNRVSKSKTYKSMTTLTPVATVNKS